MIVSIPVFVGEETVSEMLSDLPKGSQLVMQNRERKSGLQSLSCWLVCHATSQIKISRSRDFFLFLQFKKLW